MRSLTLLVRASDDPLRLAKESALGADRAGATSRPSRGAPSCAREILDPDLLKSRDQLWSLEFEGFNLPDSVPDESIQDVRVS